MGINVRGELCSSSLVGILTRVLCQLIRRTQTVGPVGCKRRLKSYYWAGQIHEAGVGRGTRAFALIIPSVKYQRGLCD